jgi:hypothetical protein
VNRRLARGENTAWCVRAASDVVPEAAMVVREGIDLEPVAFHPG